MMRSKTIIDWDNGTFREQEPVFIDFIQYLKSLNINVLFIGFSDSNYMSIYMHSIEDVKLAKSVVDEQYSEIIDRFFEIVTKTGQTLKYDRSQWQKYSLTSIYSFEIKCIERIVRHCKELIIEELNNNLIIKPKYVFSHSAEEQEYSFLPGYYLIFESPKDLAKIDTETRFFIESICDKILSENKNSGYYDKGKIGLSYYDAITDSKSLFGMFRED